MKIVEIFNSVEGEGKRVGIPCTFIRLFGCNLCCSYCDSRYACEGDNYYVMSVEEILTRLQTWDCRRVTVTGGEPLTHPGINKLLYALSMGGYAVNIETNGSQILSHQILNLANVFITIDYKSLSSGMNEAMNRPSFYRLRSQDVLKCVVGDQQDLDDFLAFTEEINTEAQIYVSPIFGRIEASKIVEYIQNHKLFDWHVQLQLHKYIWDPEERGV